MQKHGKYFVSVWRRSFVLALITFIMLVSVGSPLSVRAEKESQIQPRESSQSEAGNGETSGGAENGKPVYHAAMGIQTATSIWIQRWGYFEKSQNEYYGTENYSKLYAAGGVFYDGTFEDVEIKGNGTYTVSLKDADFAGETAISQMHIATDIPLAESEKLSFTDVILEINGSEVVKFDEAVLENEEPYLQGGAVILLMNHWRDSVIQALSSMGKSEDSSNGWELLQGSGSENVSITFTVSGLPYDNEEQAAKDEDGAVLSAEDGKAADTSSGKTDNTSSEELEEDGGNGGFSLGTAQIIVIVILAIVVVIIITIKRKGKGY